MIWEVGQDFHPGDERSLLRALAAEVWPGGRPKPAAGAGAAVEEAAAAEAAAAEVGGEVSGPEEEGLPAPGDGLFSPSGHDDL